MSEKKYTRSIRKIIMLPGPSISYVPLTKGRYALIDSEDAEFIGQWNWHADGEYAARIIRGLGRVRMHRLLCGTNENLVTDHRDGNGFHNFKGNLRPATLYNNAHNRGKNRNNTSGYKGASFHKQTQKWRATICINSIIKHLGYFPTPYEAHLAYCSAAEIFHGDFAKVA